MTDGKDFFNQLVKNDRRAYDNIRKIATVQGDDYATGYLLHYVYFQSYYKVIAIDLSKQQALDADPKAIQHINITGNLDRAGNKTMFFVETILDFSEGTVRGL